MANSRTGELASAPRFDVAAAARLARELYALDGAARPLPSERDQNFLLTTSHERYVLKIANASEDPTMIDAENAAMAHVAGHGVSFCPRVLPTRHGDAVGIADDRYIVRLVTYLPGVPLATVPHTANLVEKLGETVGHLDAAFADFDHAAVHRDFYWDLANAGRVIPEHLPLVDDTGFRDLVERLSEAALAEVAARRRALRQSIVHNDANDWNVLVDGLEITGIVDFGDMVHTWTVADPAVALAYAWLHSADPLATARTLLAGYCAVHPLREEEVDAVFPLACLRLCMSAAIAGFQRRERPDDDYLIVSQEPIRRTLPVLAGMRGRWDL